VDDQDRMRGPIENEQDSEARPASPRAVVGEPEMPGGTSPGPIPPGHIQIGGDSFLGTDPVTGSVVTDDWGPIPGGEPDLEPTAVGILNEDTIV
jgi:hypothetical protein